MEREIRGIAGGRWFARTWVAPSTLPQNMNAMGYGMDLGPGMDMEHRMQGILGIGFVPETSGDLTRPPTPPEAMYHSLPQGMSQLDSLAQVAASSSRLPSVKPELPPEPPIPPPQGHGDIIDIDVDPPSEALVIPEGLSRGPASRSSASPSPHNGPTMPAKEEWPDTSSVMQLE